MSETTSPQATREDLAIDAEFEPAASSLLSGGHRIRLRWAVFAGVGLVVITSLFWAATASGLIPGLNQAAQDQAALQAENQTLRTQIEAAQTECADLSTRLQVIERRADQQDSSAQTGRQDLANLTATVAALGTDATSLRSDIDALKAVPALTSTIDPETGETMITATDPALLNRLDALEQAITQFPATDPATTTQTDSLTTEVARLRTELAALQQSLQISAAGTPVSARPEMSGTDIALALSAIEAAARRGRPFQSGYQRLVAAMPDEAAVLALQPIAATGALTIFDLREQFAALESRALDAEATDAGGATSLMRSIFGDGVKVRRAGQDNAVDRLEAAHDYLTRDNLRAAIAEIEALPPDVQSVFTDWLDNAQQRQSLDDALEALRLAMIAKDRP